MNITYILSPSNAGKSHYFLQNYQKKIVLSPVSYDKLNYKQKQDQFIHFDELLMKKKEYESRYDQESNISEISKILNITNISNILIEETHFFENDHLKILRSLLPLFKNKQLFLTFLTGSWSNERFYLDSPISFRLFEHPSDNIRKKNKLIDNYIDFFYYNKPDVVLLDHLCDICHEKNTISSFKQSIDVQTEKISRKDLFFPCCFECKKKLLSTLDSEFKDSTLKDSTLKDSTSKDLTLKGSRLKDSRLKDSKNDMLLEKINNYSHDSTFHFMVDTTNNKTEGVNIKYLSNFKFVSLYHVSNFFEFFEHMQDYDSVKFDQ